MREIPVVRAFTAIVLGASAAFLILFLPVFWYGIIVTVIVGCALYEFYTMLKFRGISLFRSFGIFIGILIPLSIMKEFALTPGWEGFFLIVALLCVFVLQMFRINNHNAVNAIYTTIFGIIYISWLFSFLIRLRIIQGYDGRWMVFFAVFVTKMADLGAYITGLLFGRHLLIPRISPRKTIQGLIGGLIFALVAGLSIKPMLPFSLLQTGVFSLILAGFGQIGDLSESLIKRDCQVKDSANIIQGVGGVMDLIDSLLFSVPVMYVILRWL